MFFVDTGAPRPPELFSSNPQWLCSNFPFTVLQKHLLFTMLVMSFPTLVFGSGFPKRTQAGFSQPTPSPTRECIPVSALTFPASFAIPQALFHFLPPQDSFFPAKSFF